MFAHLNFQQLFQRISRAGFGSEIPFKRKKAVGGGGKGGGRTCLFAGRGGEWRLDFFVISLFALCAPVDRVHYRCLLVLGFVAFSTIHRSAACDKQLHTPFHRLVGIVLRYIVCLCASLGESV